MRGTHVITRTYGDKPAILRVWILGQRSAYLTDDRHFQMMESGISAQVAIGFPIADVYEYDETIAAHIIAGKALRQDEWDKLTPISPSCAVAHQSSRRHGVG